MKLCIMILCMIALVPLASLSCSPDQQLQQYEDTLREYQNLIVNYQNEVNSLQAQLESQKQLTAKYQSDLENTVAEKEQLEAEYKNQIDQLNQQVTELQDRVDSLESYESTYTSTEVLTIVQKHEKAQEWLERDNESSPVVNRIRWQSKYSGAGNWMVTMFIEGEIQCSIVFGFNEQDEQVEVIRDSCP